MKISVALPVYNGMPYLEQQFKSIIEQSRKPDEIIVTDDSSTDESGSFIRNIKQKSDLDIRLIRNESTLDVARNYEKAIRYCTGDLILLCDQDDVWLPNKIETMVRSYRHSDAGLLWHNAEIVDENLSPIDDLWSRNGFSFEEQEYTDQRELFQQLVCDENFVQGASILVETDFLKEQLPFPSHRYDYFLAIIACLFVGIEPVGEVLSLYRQHDSQDLGAPPKNIIGKSVQSLNRDLVSLQTETLKMWERIYQDVLAAENRNLRLPTRPIEVEISRRLQFERKRNKSLTGTSLLPRIQGVIQNARDGNYRRFNHTLFGPMRDMLVILTDWLAGI